MIHYLLSLRSIGHLVGDVIAHADNESCQHPLHPLNKRSTLKGAEGEKGLVLLSLWFVLMNGVTLFLPQHSTAQHTSPPSCCRNVSLQTDSAAEYQSDLDLVQPLLFQSPLTLPSH